MPRIPPSQNWPRDPENELHCAVIDGSTERTLAALSTGAIDMDGTWKGYTPLMNAAGCGHSRVVRILLDKGASVAVIDDNGATALHVSAQQGHLAVTKLLVKAGADLEAKASTGGATPLRLAAGKGHSEVMGVLMVAGANANSRGLDGGTTSLYLAAQNGHVAAIKVLLRGKADPLLTFSTPSGNHLPLDAAATPGHVSVVRELIRQVGIDGCGGASHGVEALKMAAANQHVEIMALLTDAGVVDTGTALNAAAECRREASVKFLLQQRESLTGGEGAAAYVNTRSTPVGTPLLGVIFAPFGFSTSRNCELAY